MSELIRFGVSLEKELLTRFDRHIRRERYPSRSEAIEDLIRKELIQKDWIEGKDVAGVVSFVFNHHKRDLVSHLTDIQHGFHALIVSSQHIHLDHDNCMEIVTARGSSKKIKKLSEMIRSHKGVKDCHVTLTTTSRQPAED
ncbi:MAG: nickel-responsive transcriptional regulator NikR [Candidatus Aureabacteria bacterium]|nr:nickel-responsive transcriptional regulator NikR [Candidatus Auribacterota bacterium]